MEEGVNMGAAQTPDAQEVVDQPDTKVEGGEAINDQPDRDDSVPYGRFNEVIAEKNELKKQLEMQQRLIDNIIANRPQQTQVQEQDPLAGEDLDPQTRNLLKKVTTHFESRISKTEGLLKYSNLKTSFLSENPDAAKYMKDIETYCNDQYKRSGAIIPFDTAYEVIKARNMSVRASRQTAAATQETTGQPARRRTPPVVGPSTGGHATKKGGVAGHGGFSDDDLMNAPL